MEPVKGNPQSYEPRKLGRPSIWSVIWKKLKSIFASPFLIKGALMSAAIYFGYVLTRHHYERLSEFLNLLTKNQVMDVMIYGSFISFRSKAAPSRVRITNRAIMSDNLLLQELRMREVPFTCSMLDDRLIATIFSVIIPTIGLVFYMRAQNPSTKPKRSSRKKAPLVTFEEVGGNEKPKKELKEVLSCLKNPARFKARGVRIPKGVLLFGPPGTGKTMLAKAVARQCDLPFLYASGAQFAQLYVGVGPKRVRQLFEQAKRESPCIVFLDELDALGVQRGDRLSSCREHDMTLNQLLNELDGFNSDEGVVVIAATNREKLLDKALVRAGRFDKRIKVGLPDTGDRKNILGIHLRMKHHDVTEDELIQVARSTKGLSGAQLENIVNDATISAIERGQILSGELLLEITKEKVKQVQNFSQPDQSVLNNNLPHEYNVI